MAASGPPLTIHSIRARPVLVSLANPRAMAGGTVGRVPLVLIDLLTEEGIAGVSYLFCFAPFALGPTAQLAGTMSELVVGHAVAPLALEQTLRASHRMIGPQGLVGMVMAGIDMAAWDALAKATSLPLVRLLGGAPHAIPAYFGLGRGDAAPVAAEVEAAVAKGLRAVKVKVGAGGVRDDLALIHAARQAAGAELALLVDYNQALSVPEAIVRLRELDGKGLAWVEEPTVADDVTGQARIARETTIPIQLGENWWGPRDMARSLAAEASDYAMLDVMKIGGVPGWLRASALAEAAGIPVSSHLFPEISVHLLGATPTAHWLEYHDWVSPIVQQPVALVDGQAMPSSRPGAGIAWDEAAVARYIVG